VYLLTELKHLTINRQTSGLKVCPDCWEPDHPQNDVARAAVLTTDPQALFDPRPERNREQVLNITWGWNPLYSLVAVGQIGIVTVVTP
jgi:hypothetical protein